MMHTSASPSTFSSSSVFWSSRLKAKYRQILPFHLKFSCLICETFFFSLYPFNHWRKWWITPEEKRKWFHTNRKKEETRGVMLFIVCYFWLFDRQLLSLKTKKVGRFEFWKPLWKCNRSYLILVLYLSFMYIHTLYQKRCCNCLIY